MLIKPEKKYHKPLADLWHKVFGDDYCYINLLFDSEFSICDTFIKEYDGVIASVLYLLNCNLSFGDKIYRGKYLYAAATHPDYRGKGIMTDLINEAKIYCTGRGDIDFISLVPADEGLYDYYGRFGFVASMHRYKTVIDNSSTNTDLSCVRSVEATPDNIRSYRKLFKASRIFYPQEDFKYVVDCVRYGSTAFYKLSDDAYFIYDNDDSVVYEFISSEYAFEADVQKLLSCLSGKVTVYSPYNLSEYGTTEKLRYGMIYPINPELERDWKISDIYMNLALD